MKLHEYLDYRINLLNKDIEKDRQDKSELGNEMKVVLEQFFYTKIYSKEESIDELKLLKEKFKHLKD